MSVRRKLRDRWIHAFARELPAKWWPNIGDLVWVSEPNSSKKFRCVQMSGNVVSAFRPDWLLVLIRKKGKGRPRLRPYNLVDVRPRRRRRIDRNLRHCPRCRAELTNQEMPGDSNMECWRCCCHRAKSYRNGD